MAAQNASWDEDEHRLHRELALHQRYFEVFDALIAALLAPAAQETLEDALQILADVAGSDAVGVYINDVNGLGARLSAVWREPTSTIIKEVPESWRWIEYARYPMLADTLAVGMVFNKSLLEASLAGQSLLVDAGARRLFCIPLLDRDEQIGFLAFLNTDESQSPATSELRFLSILANHVAQALQRQRAEEELRANQQRLRALVGATQDMVFELDTKQQIVRVWSRLEVLPGPDDILGMPITKALPLELASGIVSALPRILVGDSGSHDQFNCTIENGDAEVYLLVRLQSLDAGNERHVVAMVQDVSSLMEEAASRKTMLDTLNLLEEAIVDMTPQGELTETTSAWLRLRGLDMHDLVSELGKPLSWWVREEDIASVQSALARLEESEGTLSQRFRMKTASGEVLWVEAKLIAHRGPNGALVAVRGVLRDVTTAHLNEQHITQLALYDNLTRLPNRILLDSELHQAMDRARRNNTRMALGFIDLDHFKQVNDVLGHKAGDELLVNLAQQLSLVVQDHGMLARWGGDEFVALLPDLTDTRELPLVAEALRQAALRGVVLEGLETRPTISVGFAVFPDDADTSEELLSAADHTMYHAKNNGRNNACFYSDIVRSKTLEREHLALMAQLNSAIEQNRLEVFYQPILNAKTREVMAVEALARWQDEQSRWVSPELFIPMAEKSGLIQELSAQVIKRSFAKVRDWRMADLNQRLMVNISRSQLYQSGLVHLLMDALNEYDLQPDDVILEITESVALTDYSRQIKHLRQLADAGFVLAIDDFGTGYSSLSQLHEVPARYLKVDMSFTQRLHTPEGRSVMQAITQLGQRLGMEVIAEGVEDHDTELHLLELGVNYLQGYYYSEPAPPGVIDIWLRLGGNRDWKGPV